MEPIIAELQSQFGVEQIVPQAGRDGIPTAWIPRSMILDVLRYLKSVDKPYRMLFDLTAIDERTRRHRRGQPAGDFTVVYHLLSFERNEDIRLKAALEGEEPEVPSATGIWASANWYEREIWDMFGIRFEGHPHLRRILMPRDWKGHPLRKEHPARATEMGPFTMPEEVHDYRERSCSSIGRMGMGAARESDLMFLNLGPHIQDNPFRIILQLDGEEIVDMVLDIGFTTGPPKRCTSGVVAYLCSLHRPHRLPCRRAERIQLRAVGRTPRRHQGA